MASATISEVKNGLSAYLRKVKAGETVVIMDRKTPIAVLAPISADVSHDQRVQGLLAAGTLSREADAVQAAGAQADVAAPVDVAEPEALMEVLLEERRQSR